MCMVESDERVVCRNRKQPSNHGLVDLTATQLLIVAHQLQLSLEIRE